jgi:hypothetical protein
MDRLRSHLVVSAVLIAPALTACAQPDASTPPWLQPPRLAVMTGFLKDPEVRGTLEDWAKGVGSELGEARWVKVLAESGVSYLIFYDKWHDGLVCHDTKTTGYTTQRDLLRPVADACHSAELPLVVYWNGCYDNNPDFAEYVTLDAAGKPILFPGAWAMRLLSVHSPFRAKAEDQLREIVRDYGPIAGMWLDCYSQPWPATDRYTTQAFTARYGVAPDAATPGQGWEFVRKTLADYLAELRGVADEQQREVCFTINGSAMGALHSPLGATELQSQLQFLSVEGHNLPAMDQQALAAATLARPTETGDLISASWFSPPPPMAPGRARQALAECAVAWCQGANVYLAITPDYEGRFGEELDAVRLAGQWLRERRDLLAASEPWPDVGVILGAPSPSLPGPPSLQQLWGLVPTDNRSAWDAAADLLRKLQGLGYGGRVLYELGDMARWPDDLSGFRALIVAERACLGPEHLERLRRYVSGGGTLLVFGNGTRADADGAVRPAFGLSDVLGVQYLGTAEFPPEAGPVACYADSEYGHGWVRANLVDGTEAGWASADSPMPHWAQVNLPVETPVAKVRVTARRGGYILRDFDVLTWNGAGWDLVQTFAENAQQVVECPVDPPRKTLGIRVHVRAETCGGQDRQLADIEEIEVIGPDGRLLSRHEPYRLEAQFIDPRLAGPQPASTLAGPALVAETTHAHVLATFRAPKTGESRPLLTRNTFGKGTAVWVAVGEAGLQRADWLSRLAQLLVGPPTVQRAPDATRHRVILRHVPSGLLLCVLDTQPQLPAEVAEVRLNAEQSGLRGEVADVADAGAIVAERDGPTLMLSVKPDPAAVVLVR